MLNMIRYKMAEIDRKNLTIGALVVGMPIVVSILLLFMVFRPIPGEENDIDFSAWVNPKSYSVSREDFQKIVTKVQSIKQEKKTSTYPEPRTTIKFTPNTPPEVQELNKRIYQITEKYWNSDNFKTVNKDWIDPLFFFALGNIELGGSADSRILFTPAVPTAYLDRQISLDLIETFGVDDLVNSSKYWNYDRDTYLGPLQMSPLYGLTSPMIPADLKGNERDRIILGLNGDKLPTYMVGITFSQSGDTGDRFNWGDTVNRASGYMKRNYNRYLTSQSVRKDGDTTIDNKYSFMALLSIGHNTGEATVFGADSQDETSSLSFWPWGPAVNCRRYAYALGRQEVVEYILGKAGQALKTARDGNKRLPLQIDRNAALVMIRDMVSKGILKDDYWVSLSNGSREEKVAYPVQVLYSYMMLDLVFKGE